MDFKVTGTRDGVTALQMDIKVQGISEAIIRDGLKQALRAAGPGTGARPLHALLADFPASELRTGR